MSGVKPLLIGVALGWLSAMATAELTGVNRRLRQTHARGAGQKFRTPIAMTRLSTFSLSLIRKKKG